MSPFISYFVLIFVLLLMSAFFSASETTFFSLSRSQVAKFKKSSNPLAKQLIHFLANPRDTLVTILFGNEIVNISISILIAGLVYRAMGDASWEKSTLVAVTIATLLILICGEIVPKNIAIIFASTIAPFMALLLKPLYLLLKPLRVVLGGLAEWIITTFGGEPEKESPLIVEEEFRFLLELGTSTGQMAEEERELIHKFFEFEEKVVLQIMTPFDKTFCLAIDTPYEDLLKQVKETQFSRIPICEGPQQNIIGVLYVKDLFQFNQRHTLDTAISIREILRQPLFIFPHQKLEDILEKFREVKIHMGIVMGKKGKPAGIVTMHDVLEELFGKVEE